MFSSDSGTIAFYRNQTLYVFDLSTKTVKSKLDLRNYGDIKVHDIQFSPDNQHLLFQMFPSKHSDRKGLFTYNYINKVVKKIEEYTFFYAISPDGEKIMYSGGPGDNRGLYLMDMTGNSKTRISPDWRD